MAKKTDEKKEFARILYMNGTSQKEISEKIGVSKQTVNKWVAQHNWAELRAAQNISRPELINKILRAIDKELEDNLNNPGQKANSDRLSKLAATIKSLDKKASVVDIIEAFMGFGVWLNQQAGVDKDLSEKLLKDINRYQDMYITQLLGNNAE